MPKEATIEAMVKEIIAWGREKKNKRHE
jgi:hypothetical protein